MLYGAAAGLAVIVISVVMAVVRAGINKRRGQNAFVVIPSGSDVKLLERRVRAYSAEQLFCDPRYRCGIVILLTDERLSEAAHRLCGQLDGVSVAECGELDECISQSFEDQRRFLL